MHPAVQLICRCSDPTQAYSDSTPWISTPPPGLTPQLAGALAVGCIWVGDMQREMESAVRVLAVDHVHAFGRFLIACFCLNSDRITARIGDSPPDSGTGSAPWPDGKAAPHPGAARETQLKKKSSGMARRTREAPDPHPLPDRTPWPPRNANGRYSARRSDRRYCFGLLATMGMVRCTFPVFGSTVSVSSTAATS
jgi:hypothetical protein